MQIPPISETTIFISICFGLISSYLAYKRRKNPYLWFFIGFFLGALGFFAIILFSNFKKKAPKKKRISVLTLEGPQDKMWFYLDDSHNQIGPLSFQSMKDKVKEGSLQKQSFVWYEGLASWKKLEELLKVRMMPQDSEQIK